MTYRHLFLATGFISTFPSIYFYAWSLLVLVLVLSGELSSSAAPRLQVGRFVGFCLMFVVASGLAGLAGSAEAQRFAARALVCVLIMLLFAYGLPARKDDYFHAYFIGVLAGAAVNSVAVLVFAFAPDLYDTLGVGAFSGYDKGQRLLRSPGLQTGTDTAGYLAVVGAVAYLYLRRQGVKSFVLRAPALYLLLLAPLFCSRTSMLLSAAFGAVALFAWRDSLGMLDKLAIAVVSGLAAVVGVTLGAALLLPDTVGLAVSSEILGVSLDSVYALSSGESYVDQYDFSRILTWLPSGDPDEFDNAVGRILASTGIMGVIAGALVVFYLVAALLRGARPGDRSLVVAFAAVYVFANAKNNYVFYPLFIAMAAVLLGRLRPSRGAALPAVSARAK